MSTYDVRTFEESLAMGLVCEAAVRGLLEARGWRTWDTAEVVGTGYGILDAVEHAGIIETDAQVSLLTACKAYDKESPGIAVHIAEIDEVDAAALSQLLNKVTGGE